jgi:hypothetical protein
MLEANIDLYAVQAGFFESEDGTDFLPDVEEISFCIASTMETGALRTLADSLGQVAQPVIVSVYTPESEAFAWFDAQGVRVMSRPVFPDVWAEDLNHSPADPEERAILLRASPPESHEHSLAFNEADSVRQCLVPDDVAGHGDRGGESIDIDRPTRGMGGGNISDSGNNSNKMPIEGDSHGIPAVDVDRRCENTSSPLRKAFTISSTSVILAELPRGPVTLVTDKIRQPRKDQYSMGLEMTAVLEVCIANSFVKVNSQLFVTGKESCVANGL